MKTIQPVLLVILDGFGLQKARSDNAISSAHAPTIKALFERPWTRLDPSGEAVGLPRAQMGTSEVGHLNLGAGRIVYQDLVRINKAIEDGSLSKNKAILHAIDAAKKKGGALHLLGLTSDGGVHSHLTHLFALLDLAEERGVKDVFIHAITDGRDTEPRVAEKYLRQIERRCKRLGIGAIATVVGRYYAMDRDSHWEREELAYNALVTGEGRAFKTAREALSAAYARGEGDEFVKPSVIATKSARTGRVRDGDSVLFFNFRQDRARQISHAFTDKEFDGFKRRRVEVEYTTMTCYDKALKAAVAFGENDVRMCLAEYLSEKGLKQFHVAETEKYAHVTYFFNGGREEPFPGEDRALVPSPRVATYDLQPEMSADGVAGKLIEALKSRRYGFVVVNFANADMVGHTGKLDAAVKAVEKLDECLGRTAKTAEEEGYVMLVVADHGNAEEMAGKYSTSHTLNNVPFIVFDPKGRYAVRKRKVGKLADVAPTALTIMGLPVPKEMSGEVLVEPVERK